MIFKKFFQKKFSVSFIDESWNVMKSNVKLSFLPQKDNFIYLEELGGYFMVTNVVYNFDFKNKKQDIFLILKEFNKKS